MSDRLRAYRFALDPTRAQREDLAQHAGNARWAYNHALAVKAEAYPRRELQINELVTLGFSEKQARKHATVRARAEGGVCAPRV